MADRPLAELADELYAPGRPSPTTITRSDLARLGARMGDYLLPEYLRQPPVRDVPSEPVKIPSSQIDPRAAMAFSLIDLASMAPGGGGGALAAAPLGIAARRAARAARGAVASAEEIIPAANPRAVIGGNMPPPEAKFAQYAEQYPPTGEP